MESFNRYLSRKALAAGGRVSYRNTVKTLGNEPAASALPLT